MSIVLDGTNGIDSPDLTISGTGARITGDFSNANVAQRVLIQSSTANGETGVFIAPNGASNVSRFRAYTDSTLAAGSYANIGINSTAMLVESGGPTYLPMAFYTNGSERMRITSTGRVGINTTNPGDILDVNGNVFLSSSNPVIYTATTLNLQSGFSNPIRFLTESGTERMRIDTSGNVGIGTSSPANKFEVYGDTLRNVARASTIAGDVLIEAQASDYWSGPSYRGTHLRQYGHAATGTNVGLSNAGLGILSFQNTSAGLIFTNGAAPLVFGTTSAERMRIDASGNVLVGANSLPSNASGLYVQSRVASRGYSTYNYTSFGTNTYFWTGSALQVWVDGTNLGNVSITSDYRIKQNIQTNTVPALERIEQLRPVTYKLTNYKKLYKEDGVQREGFIAHELAEVIPSAVEGEKDAEDQIQSLKLDALCSVMVKAIQELKAELDTVKAELATLKGEPI